MFYAYLKLSAKRSWQKLSDKHNNEKENKASFDDMQFACLKGIEDHGKDDLTEETLLRFGEALKKKKKGRCKMIDKIDEHAHIVRNFLLTLNYVHPAAVTLAVRRGPGEVKKYLAEIYRCSKTDAGFTCRSSRWKR